MSSTAQGNEKKGTSTTAVKCEAGPGRVKQEPTRGDGKCKGKPKPKRPVQVGQITNYYKAKGKSLFSVGFLPPPSRIIIISLTALRKLDGFRDKKLLTVQRQKPVKLENMTCT